MPPSNRALVTPLVVVLGGAAIASVLAQLAVTLWYRHWRRDRGPGRRVVVSWSDDDAEGYKDKRVMSKGHRRHRQSVYYYYNTASANVAMAPRPLTVVMLAGMSLPVCFKSRVQVLCPSHASAQIPRSIAPAGFTCSADSPNLVSLRSASTGLVVVGQDHSFPVRCVWICVYHADARSSSQHARRIDQCRQSRS